MLVVMGALFDTFFKLTNVFVREGRRFVLTKNDKSICIYYRVEQS